MSTLRLTSVPADIDAQKDANGGVWIVALIGLRGETRTIGYMVCDATGNTCAGTTITVTIT